MKSWFPFCVLILGAFLRLFANPREFSLHVLKADSAGEVVAVRWHQGKNDGPVFGFHLDSGKVFDDEILGKCAQSNETKTVKEVSFPVVSVVCAEIKMTVSSLDFAD